MQTKILTHSCPPYALVYTNNGIIIGGCDQRVVSYSETGELLQQFDYRNGSDHEKEFTIAIRNSLGHNVVFGSFDRFVIISHFQLLIIFHASSQFEVLHHLSLFISISTIQRFFTSFLNFNQF